MATDLQRARDLAWAEAFAGGARVLSTLATRLRRLHDDLEPDAAPSAVDGGGSTPEAPSVPAAPPRTRTPRGGIGPRQQKVLSLAGLDSPTGLSASDVARALNLTAPNAHAVLVRLEELDALTRVPGEKPARWRRAGDS